MATRGMRKIRLENTLDADANPGEAALAILAGSGLCGEHARVASAIARQQNIAVVRVGVEKEDHGAALLRPQRGSKAIVVDAWTTIPTSCLVRALQAGFPERYVAAVQPLPAITASLADYALRRLQTRESPAPPCIFHAATHTDLQLLGEALTHSPQATFDIALQRFSALLPELHFTQIEEGVQVWKTHWRRLSEGAPLMTAAAQVMDGWARHFDDAVVEPHLRDALLLSHDPARLIGAPTRHVLMLPSMQQRALNAIDVALADMPAGEARNGVVTMVREAVVRIADTGTRAAGLAMVARHG